MLHSRPDLVERRQLSPDKPVWTSALAPDGTGIGVVQRRLAAVLRARGIDLRTLPGSPAASGLLGRLAALFRRALARPPRRAVFLSLTSPFPIFAPRQSLAVVYDLRWQRTRGLISRYYRKFDLLHAARRATTLVCISQRTRDDLIREIPSCEAKAVAAWLGPGLMPPQSFTASDTGILLLIGSATHKRNELAARLLTEARPPWLQSIEGVGVTLEVVDILGKAFGPDKCTWHERLPNSALVETYKRAQYFMLLSLEEGFGMPFVEALSAGCTVIAIDQPLTRELLGHAAVLLREHGPEPMTQQLRNATSPDSETRLKRASAFSWDKFADAIESAFRSQ